MNLLASIATRPPRSTRNSRNSQKEKALTFLFCVFRGFCVECRPAGSQHVRLQIALLVLLSAWSASCRRSAAPEPPVATPSVTLDRNRAPLGSPVDLTYKFVVAA